MKTQSSSSVTPDLFTTQGPYRGDTPAGAVGGRARVESLAPEGPASPVLHVGWGLSIAAHEHLATTQVSHGKLPVAKKKTRVLQVLVDTIGFLGDFAVGMRAICVDLGLVGLNKQRTHSLGERSRSELF